MSNFNINIGIFGTVSSGKSTLINSLLLQELSTMNISRNTMIPQIYREIINNKTKQVKAAQEINKEISEINMKIRNITDMNENVETLLKPITFYIHKLKELKLCQKNIYLSFYDIPGLNDNKNHRIYYKYASENFNEFDIVLYMIDLHTGLNTKDEVDLLNFVCKYAAKHNKFVIPIINKSDDMTMLDNKLMCDSKYKDNYDNIIKIFEEYTKKYYIPKMQTPILYSASESFMYRMLSSNPDYELSEEMRNTIGFNDMGKKYFTLSTEERISKVKEIVRDENFIQTMINMCGYKSLYNTLKKILTIENQKNICQTKLLTSYNKLNNTTEITFDNIFTIYEEFSKLYKDSLTLQNIFEDDENILNTEFITNTFSKLIKNVDNTIYDDIIQLKTCINKLQEHEYKIYLVEQINECNNNIQNYIKNYYNNHYVKKYTLLDLIENIKDLKSYKISNSHEYVENYIHEIKMNDINFYKDLDPINNNLITLDTKYQLEIEELKELTTIQLVKNLTKYLIKNKICSLITLIEKNINKEYGISSLYNMMTFYNYYSNKDIEYSEIYTLLLSNYIGIISNNNQNLTKLDKDDNQIIIDSKFVNL